MKIEIKPKPIVNGYIVSGGEHKCAICGKPTTKLEVFSESYICSKHCEEKFYKMVSDAEKAEDLTIDEVGGVHEEGLGWNPNGVFCGECSNSTCKGCVNENAEK